MISFRVSDGEHQELLRYCEEHRLRSISDLARQALGVRVSSKGRKASRNLAIPKDESEKSVHLLTRLQVLENQINQIALTLTNRGFALGPENPSQTTSATLTS